MQVEKNLLDLKTDGFTVLENLFNTDTLSKMVDDYRAISRLAEETRQVIHKKERIFFENEQEIRSAYWQNKQRLVLEAGKGRYDLYKGFHQGCFLENELYDNSTFDRLMKGVMVDDYSHYSGFIQSFPGSKAQYWHRDTHTLSNTSSDGSSLIGVDDFYFTKGIANAPSIAGIKGKESPA